jgi:hypothetical protein
MGSPLSSFLAEAVMQDLESKAVTNNDDIKTWDRYVDDVLATVKKDKTDDILLTINNTTKNIKFTKEEEHDNKLAFLDVLITKTDNGTLTTQVYRKKTHTDQILNYNSNHPTQHKVSCIKTLFNRIDTHCNTDQSKQDERKYLYSSFYKNDYPLDFINKVLQHKQQTNTDRLNQTKTRITLPYIHTTSEMTARLLRPFNIDVAHKPTCKLRSNFTKHKDKTHITEKHNAIYIFPCKNCPDKYIGQPYKKIQTRLTEHQNAINRHDHSSLPAKHTDDNKHKFNSSQTRYLGQATTKHAREFKEAWHSLDKQTFNRHIDIPTIYLQLKRWHKSPNSSSLTFKPPSTSFPTPSHDNNNHPHSIVTNGNQNTEIHQPIRRSHRLQQRQQQRENSKDQSF